MGRLIWLALGLLAFGGCSLAGSWSHRERLAEVPRMTCDQLLRDGPGADGLVTLTDARVGRRGHVGRRDAVHPGDIELLVPVYPAHLPQEPEPKDLVLLLEVRDDDIRQHLLGSPGAVEITCLVHTGPGRVEGWAREGLAAKYPGLRLVDCRVLTVGLHEPSPVVARRMERTGVVAMVAGGTLLGLLALRRPATGLRSAEKISTTSNC